MGVHSALSFSVTRWVRELGLGIALAARPLDVISITMRTSMALIAKGIAIGTAAALGLTGLLRALLFGVTPADPFTFATMGGSVVIASAITAYIPAIANHASVAVVALREE